jgi:hypothetical protein
MTKLALVVALAAALAPAPARADLPLAAPAGWDDRSQEGARVLAPRDLPAGKLYTVMVPRLTAPLGSLGALLDAARATLAQAGSFRPAGDPQRARNAHGWDFEMIAGPLEKDGRALIAAAVAMKSGDGEGIILVIADSLGTMELHAGALAGMIQSVGAPAIAPSVGGVDLRYRAPPGWTARPLEGAVLLEKSADTLYDRYTYRIIVLPSAPLHASLRETFLASWKAAIAPAAGTRIAPLPLMRRLRSGAALAYDADVDARSKDGTPITAGLLVLARGARYVPVAVFLAGGSCDDRVERELTSFVESAEIPGAGDRKVALFAAGDLVGEWSVSSASLASYVTASGAHAGDASVATGSTIVLRADGTFERSFLGISREVRVRERDAGKWSIDDAHLVQEGRSKQWNTLLGVGADPRAGAFLVLGTYANKEQNARLCNPRGLFQGEWYRRRP